MVTTSSSPTTSSSSSEGSRHRRRRHHRRRSKDRDSLKVRKTSRSHGKSRRRKHRSYTSSESESYSSSSSSEDYSSSDSEHQSSHRAKRHKSSGRSKKSKDKGKSRRHKHHKSKSKESRRIRLNNSTSPMSSSSPPPDVPGQLQEGLVEQGHEQPATGMAAQMRPPLTVSTHKVGALQRLVHGVDSSSEVGLETFLSHSTGMPLQPIGADTNVISLEPSASPQIAVQEVGSSTIVNNVPVLPQVDPPSGPRLRRRKSMRSDGPEDEEPIFKSADEQETAFQEVGSLTIVNNVPVLPQADPPSGPMLRHRKSVRSDGPEDEDPVFNVADEQEPGYLDGRGCTKCVDEQPLKVNRIHITISAISKSFIPSCANTSISSLLRKLYRGDAQWDNVSMQTRDKLWRAFGMRFRWDDDKVKDVVELWYYLNRAYFVSMISHAKQKWKRTHMRESWCPVNYFYKLERYWKRSDIEEVAVRNSINRGVVYDSRGKVVKRAGGTFTGGSKSTIKRDVEALKKEECPKVGFLIGNYMKTHMYTGVKKKKKKKRKRGDEGVENAVGSSQDELAVESSEEPRWLNTTSEQTLEQYNKLIDEKYRDRPQEKPSIWDPRDEECWAIASGGPKKGKVLGVSKSAVLEEFGYTNVKRRMTEGDVHLHTDASLQKTIEAMILKHKEETLAALEQQRLSLQEQFAQDRQTMLSDFKLERERLQSQLSTAQIMFEHTNKRVEELMSRLPSQAPQRSDSDGLMGIISRF